MRQKQLLIQNGYNHVTTRINTFSGNKEHLFYNKRLDEQIIVLEVV